MARIIHAGEAETFSAGTFFSTIVEKSRHLLERVSRRQPSKSRQALVWHPAPATPAIIAPEAVYVAQNGDRRHK